MSDLLDCTNAHFWFYPFFHNNATVRSKFLILNIKLKIFKHYSWFQRNVLTAEGISNYSITRSIYILIDLIAARIVKLLCKYEYFPKVSNNVNGFNQQIQMQTIYTFKLKQSDFNNSKQIIFRDNLFCVTSWTRYLYFIHASKTIIFYF